MAKKLLKKISMAMLLGLFTFGPIQAKPQWEYKRVSHVAMGESLVSFFSDLGAGADVLVQLSTEVREKRDLVTATYSDKKIIDILNDISNAHGLIWYWDGQTIYIYDLSELQERKIELNDDTSDDLIQALRDYGFYDGRYIIKSNTRGNVAYFSAPPRYAQLILQIADEVNQSDVQQKNKNKTLIFKAFPLKYATAYDREVDYNGQKQIIPGVASLLQSVVGGGSLSRTFRTNLPKQNRQSIGNRSSSSSNNDEAMGDVINLNTQPTESSRQSSTSSITADKQTNSIVIYDTAEKIRIYSNFIQDFDKPVAQIEISVSIIDVQSNEMNEIGINWAGNGTDFDVGFGGTAAIESTNQSAAFIGFGNYQNTTTLLASQVKTMMGNIKAIQANNGAKILSKPAVVTQDNLEAIIDHISTFYVRLEGQEEVELVPIQSGSVLRVVPRLLGTNTSEEAEIQLKVSIRDGTTTNDISSNVDNIPIVNSSTIKTQAVISNNESLLVGGFYYDSEQDDVQKVPFLGDIPLIKSLFRQSKTRKVQLSRLFLITPRIVGNKMTSMEKMKVIDSIDDVSRHQRKDYFFKSIIMD